MKNKEIRNEMSRFIEENFGCDKPTVRVFKNVNYLLSTERINGKLRYRQMKNISILVDGETFKICGSKGVTRNIIMKMSKYDNVSGIKSNVVDGFKLYVGKYIDFINVINPIFELLNMKYPKNHFKLDYENNCIIVNNRLRIFLNNDHFDFGVFYREKVEHIYIYTNFCHSSIFRTNNLFEFSQNNSVVNMKNHKEIT